MENRKQSFTLLGLGLFIAVVLPFLLRPHAEDTSSARPPPGQAGTP